MEQPNDQSLVSVLPDGAVFEREGIIVTDSMAVADAFGRAHYNLIRDIRVHLSHASDLRDGTEGWFRPIEGPHPTIPDRKIPGFEMTRDGLSMLVMGFTGARAHRFKVLFIQEFNRMEAALRQPVAPLALNDPATLRGLLLGYTEQVLALTADNERLGAKVEHLAPKAAALDLLSTKIGEENITNCAKALGLRPGRMFDWLALNGWVFRARDGAPWRAYQAKIDAGLLVHRESPDRTREDRSFLQVKITPKGRAKLAELLSQGDMLARAA